MEVATGATASLITQKMLERLSKLQQSNVMLQTYTAEAMTVLLVMNAHVKDCSFKGELELFVVEGPS